jgi:peptide/nickel transport system substrate-binding protein
MRHLCLGILLAVALGCTPPAAVAPSQQAGQGPAPRRSTSITIILQTEVGAFSTRLGAVGANSVSSRYFHEFVNAYLTTRDPTNELVPWLAAELPKLDNGMLKLLEDGGMEVTWKLRPGVLWHDGVEVTSSDVLFGWEAARDPITQIAPRGISRSVESVATPDRYTAVFRWRQTSQYANEAGEEQFELLPRHILEDDLLASKEDFSHQPFFSSPEAFVGLGPYRPVSWERGSHITLEAFDRYFLGRPRIDRVTFKFIRDSQTSMSQLLAGAADMSYQTPQYENAQIIAERWAQSDGGSVQMLLSRARVLHTQFRPEVASPADLLDPRVRKALAHALDRQSAAEAVLPGFAQVADSLTYQDAIGRAATQTVVRYAYDPSRALALLDEAGWRQGPDGALMKGGERFVLEYRYAVQADAETLYPILQRDYRKVGIETTVHRLVGPENLQAHALYPGVVTSGVAATIPAIMSRFSGSQVARPQNRYTGTNASGYQNLEIDRLFATIDSSVRAEDRVRLWAEVWGILTDEVALIPLYYFPSPYVLRKGIQGPLPANPADTPTFMVHTWEVQ